MRRVTITTSWDDGHVMDLRVADLLRRYGLPGTFYIAPKDHEFSRRQLLSAAQIKLLSKDFEIGAHTMTHPRLTQVSDRKARWEMKQSKDYLQHVTGQPVTSFCYPCGDYAPRHVQMARALGFTFARSVRRFALAPGSRFAAQTTIHAYRHYSDVWHIAKAAKFIPTRFVDYLLNWENLAIALFEQARRDGGVFHLWGHSWEVDKNGDWQRLERLLAYLGAQKNVQHATNAQLTAQHKPKLLLATPYFPPRVGGLERYAQAMAQGVRLHGYDVVVVTSGETRRAMVSEEDGLRVYRLPVQFKVMNTPVNLGWYWQLKRIIKQENPDIINAHMPVPYLGDMAVLAAGKRPVVITYHSGSMQKGRVAVDAIVGLYERLVLPRLLARAARVIASSNAVRDTFLRAPATTITPGVSPHAFPRRKRAPAVASVVFLGNHLNDNKGLHYLCSAVKQLPGVQLAVVGEGPAVPSERTTYYGTLQGKALVRQLHRASVLVLPSTNQAEGFGMVLLEAMACGVPVIASKVGGIPSVIEAGKTGLLVPPRDVDALVVALRRVLNDPVLAAELADNGVKAVQTKFSWKRQVATYMALLEELR